MVQLDETKHVEVVAPLCHWCDQPLDGGCENGLHKTCVDELRKNDQPWYEQHHRIVRKNSLPKSFTASR
jgi:hypothetical protein